MTENPEKITPAKKAFYAFLSVLAIVLLLVGWMLIARVRPYLFPSPVAVWQRFLLILEKPTGRYPLYIHILDSLKRVGIAVTFASFFGVILGVLLGDVYKRQFQYSKGSFSFPIIDISLLLNQIGRAHV